MFKLQAVFYPAAQRKRGDQSRLNSLGLYVDIHRSRYSTPSRVRGWDTDGADTTTARSSENGATTTTQRGNAGEGGNKAEVAVPVVRLPGKPGATLPAGLSGEALMAVLQVRQKRSF